MASFLPGRSYGPAEDIPPLLESLYTKPIGFEGTATWEELWNALYHQGDITTAAYAALPHILEIASASEEQGKAQASWLACHLMPELLSLPMPKDIRAWAIAALRTHTFWEAHLMWNADGVLDEILMASSFAEFRGLYRLAEATEILRMAEPARYACPSTDCDAFIDVEWHHDAPSAFRPAEKHFVEGLVGFGRDQTVAPRSGGIAALFKVPSFANRNIAIRRSSVD